jgi:hypothetical protein
MVILLAAIAIGGCGKSGGDVPVVTTAAPATQPASEDDATEAAQLDADAEKSLAEPGKYEARDWLTVAHHSTFKISHDAAVKTVDDFYAAGAPHVWVAGVEDIDISQVAAEIIIEIPADSADRQRVFDVMHDLDKTEEDDLTRDVGQKYFVLTCD